MPTPMIPGIPPLLPLGIRRNSREPAGTLSPEEEESLAKKAGKIGLGGIAALGNLIDLPGSMVRDVMVGENPLDQLLHPFSGESRTYGRDMLRKAGMIGQKDTLLNALPGLAIDIATDPLTWIMPFGALTKAGKVVKQAGMLPKVRNIAARLYDDAGAHAPGVIVPGAPRRAAPSGARLGEMGPRRAAVRTTLRDVLGFASPEELTALKRAAEASGSTLQQLADQPLRGMFATGAFGNPWRVMASGPRGEKVAQFLDRAQQAVVHGKVPHTNFAPVERMAQLFNARIGGAPGDVAGYFGKLAFGAKESARAAANTKVAEFANSLVKAGISTPEQMDLVRRALEEIPVTSREVILRNPATPAAAAAAQTAMSQLPPEVQEILRKAQAYKQQIFDSVKAEGGRISEYASPEALHWPRYGLADEFPEQQFQSGAGISRSFDVRNQSAARRNPIFSPYESPQGMKYGIKDETTTIRQMLMDDEINLAIDTYETPEVVANIIRRKYGNKIPRLFNEVNGTAGDRYNALAKWAANLSPEQRKFGFFANDPLRDLHSYAVVGAGQAASLRVLREFLQSKGVMHFPGSAARQAGWHELGDVLQKVAGHIDRDVFGKHLLDDTLRAMTPQEVAGFRHSLAASLGKPIQELTDADMIGVVMKSRMSDDSATAIQRLAMGFSRPEPANAILQVFDSMTNLWKNFQTGVFPAFHTRNLISGQVNNWFAGNWSRESVKMTRDLLRGGTVKGASQLDAVKQLAAQRGIASLTDEQATQLLGELAYAHNMTGRYAGEAMSQAGVEAISRPQQLGDLMREIPRPGYQAMSGKRLINKLLGREPGTSWKPWDVRGVRGRAEVGRALHAAAPAAEHALEDLRHHPGAGIAATRAGRHWRLGKPEFALGGLAPDAALQARIDALRSAGYLVIALADAVAPQALFLLRDQPRPGIATLLARLRTQGVRQFVLLSGDSQANVTRFAADLAFDPALGDQRPEDKLNWIHTAQQQGRRVAMVGDGINDAPTLAAADVSISFAHASELAQVHSELLVLGRDLAVIATARAMAQRTRRIIRQNLAWAASYNLLSVPAAAAGLVPPWAAAVGMSLSSLLVVLNALRLRDAPAARGAHRLGAPKSGE